jgi:hypothetical protein
MAAAARPVQGSPSSGQRNSAASLSVLAGVWLMAGVIVLAGIGLRCFFTVSRKA